MGLLILYLVLSVLMIAAGIPMAMQIVPPNRWYGFRTPKTLSSPEAWYPVNRIGGLWLVGTGIVMGAVAGVVFLAGFEKDTAALINVTPCMLGLIGAVIHGLWVSRRF